MLIHSTARCIPRWPDHCVFVRPRTVSTRAQKPASSLLYWATEKNPLYEQLPVVIEHGDFGRCLIAQRDIQPEEVVLSVCTDHVFMCQAPGELEIHWAAEMALRLLKAKHTPQATDSSSSSTIDNSMFWKPWIDSLPERPVTPVEFTAEEAKQLVFPNAVDAVLNMRTCLENCFEELQPELQDINCGWHDFLWAVQVLHSRCFFSEGRHLAVPGIDMCNHSSTAANAGVRMIHSPGACQGLRALEEVAPAAAEAEFVTKSYFQLVAGPDGIPAGEQVTISYGNWPAEPFLLLFGFIPQPNPEDCIILFNNLQHMAACYLDVLYDKDEEAKQLQQLGFGERVLQYCMHAEQQRQQQQQQQEAEGSDAGPYAGYKFMFVSQNRLDGRLNGAIQLLHQAVAAAAASPAQPNSSRSSSNDAIVARRLQQLPVGDLIVYRLQQLIEQLEASIASLQQQQQPPPPRQQQWQRHEAHEEPLYQASPEHAALVEAYCNSKAALAQQLLSKYSDPISMLIAAGASRR